MTLQEAHRILQLSSDASRADIKKAFRKLAFKMHPDLNPSPDAASKFRQINEAYVFLTKNKDQKYTASSAKKNYTNSTAQESKTNASDGAKAYREQQQRAKTHTRTASSTEKTSTSRGTFYRREEEVLKDILNDPFARQVFEDIYSQIKKDRPTQFATGTTEKKLNFNWGEKSVSFNLTGGLFSGIKSWMRSQLDDTQSVYFPPSVLFPGRTVRITIAQGIRKKSKTLDITLPRDFIIGRSIRLKGQGRRLGPFKGDLYLRILAK